MMSEPEHLGRPEPYVVYWLDAAEQARLATRRRCAPEDVDPADYEQERDFSTLVEAQQFAATIYGQIEQRVNLHWVGKLYQWDWEQEPVKTEPERTTV